MSLARLHRWRVGGTIAAFGLIAVGVVAFAGCNDDDNARLDVLGDDPLVTAPVDGVASERITESPGNSGVGLSVPSTFRRTFVLDSSPIQPAIDQLAAAAEEGGWTLSPRDVVGYSGRKTIDGVDAQLVIAGVEAEQTIWLEISARG